MKPVYSTLQTRGLVSSGYLDESFLLGNSFVQSLTNVNNIYSLFGHLGLMCERKISHPAHPSSSTLRVCFELCLYDSESHKRKKIDSITRLTQDIFRRQACSIREAAQLIATFVSSCPGVVYGPLFYKQIVIEKHDALRKHKGSFEVQM